MVTPVNPQLPRIAWDNVVPVIRDGGVDASWDGKVKMLVYDTGTMTWIAYTPAGGGGGGDASAANQVTEISKLTSIDGKLPALVSSRVPVDGSGVTQPVSGTVAVSNFPATQPVSGTFFQATQPISASALPLPSGAATSANQATASASLSSIDSKLTAPLATKAPVNATGSGSAAAATVSTVTTLTAPANAVGFILMNLDTSTTNMRWAVGRTAAATLGQQLQPGRDTGFIPVGANISIIAESGTCDYDVQWVSQ